MIFIANNHPSLRFSRRETFRTINSVLDHELVRSMSVSVVFVGNRFIRRLNERYLRQNRTTDVIAFPLQDDVGVDGEIYVNLDRARSQARGFGVSYLDEARRLLIHGILHLRGYTDHTPGGKTRMRRKEDLLLRSLSPSSTHRSHARKNR